MKLFAISFHPVNLDFLLHFNSILFEHQISISSIIGGRGFMNHKSGHPRGQLKHFMVTKGSGKGFFLIIIVVKYE